MFIQEKPGKYCHMVYDGLNLVLPPSIGQPQSHHMQGSMLDNLVELAGRTCYESYKAKNSRNSADYHKHIIEVGHGSVQEHPNLTFSIPDLQKDIYLYCCEGLLNRPGISTFKHVKGNKEGAVFELRVTANLRVIREWFNYQKANYHTVMMGNKFQELAKKQAPLVMYDIEPARSSIKAEITVPTWENEIWVSFFFENVSRGFAMELIRHKYATGVSQRSTRYVTESESDWAWHPLLDLVNDPRLKKMMDIRERQAKKVYNKAIKICENFLVQQGLNSLTARKQARGAARGVLGNALSTELLFSASLAEWKHILLLRASDFSDAEIRVVMNEVFDKLFIRFPSHFLNWQKKPAEDGMGFVLNVQE